ncbi:YdeI/OmpD-associated family protein [Flavobacterium sp. F-65]|uniref:YdeI/OmpD-associated family protein n=1 Tax=Flavobacterium pisciphilum TaxID=2893755 RepID=A0ABS8MMV6_9FLAO|nr:YdeI/OmpD-associated family protein [Flavobacterium sp. F-65]MCC9069988.1 YdeI/OmpD-associated family protein [Flavobacterium sp. F-65]
MKEQIPLVDKEYLLEKFQGKGGWTFAKIPEIQASEKTPFGWVRVCGSIDDFEIKSYNLQSMGNGKLFLPVKAEIRKKIKKKEGDYVRIILYEDNLTTEITDELKLCLMDEPRALETFLSYSNAEQKTIMEWIYSAKTDKIKVKRIVDTIDTISKTIKL